MSHEQELRAELEAWFRSAADKDLDGAMRPIADDVVSYEHEAPLVYRGVDAVREVCRQGFEHMPSPFRWDVPDLELHVRGDLAVMWGLNRMRAEPPGQPPIELWSRGTRVFVHRGGRWQMIHQHVSFPYDPATGKAQLDARPV